MGCFPVNYSSGKTLNFWVFPFWWEFWCLAVVPLAVSLLGSVSSCRQRRCVLIRIREFPGISSQNRNVLQVLSQHKVAEKNTVYPCMTLGTPPSKMDGLEKLAVSFPIWEQ